MTDKKDNLSDQFEPYDQGAIKPCVEKITSGCEKCPVGSSCPEYEYICPVCYNNPCICK